MTVQLYQPKNNPIFALNGIILDQQWKSNRHYIFHPWIQYMIVNGYDMWLIQKNDEGQYKMENYEYDEEHSWRQ